MRTTWRRLGRPDAVNWIVILSVSSLALVGSFVGANFDAGDNQGLFALINVASVLCAVVVLLIGVLTQRVITNRNLRAVSTVFVLEAAALVRAFVFSTLLQEFQFTESNDLPWRIFGAQSNIFVAAVVTISFVAMAREVSERNYALTMSLAALRATQGDLAERMAARRQRLTQSIKDQLNIGLTRITGANLNNDAMNLRNLIDEVVRPISHRLGRDFTPDVIEQTEAERIKINWQRVISVMLTENPLHPTWSSLWFAVAAYPFFNLLVGSAFFFPYVTTVTLFIMWFAIAKVLWGIIPVGLGLLSRALVFTAISASFSVVATICIDLLFGLSLWGPRFIIGEALWFTVITWSVALVIALRVTLNRTNTELQTANDQLKRRLIADNVSARHFEEGLSRVLHGPVQDAIAASLKRIQSVPEGTQLTSSDLEAIRQPIDLALKKLEEPDSPPLAVEKGINDLVSLWEGVVHIEFEIEDKASLELSRSAVTSSIVIELVREAISNAIRHGDAHSIKVGLRLSGDSKDVVVNVRNDGLQLPPETVPGIGTSLLTNMSLSWSRENVGDLVLVKAVVPLQIDTLIDQLG